MGAVQSSVVAIGQTAILLLVFIMRSPRFEPHLSYHATHHTSDRDGVDNNLRKQ
jgi:hypothetical protein